MGAINVDEVGRWVVARWAFQGYLEHVLAAVRQDPDLAHAVEEAIALDGLHLSLTDPASAERLGPILLLIADDVVDGRRDACVEGRILDDASQEQFRQAVRELRGMLRHRWPS
jgi:hypothetical protein